MNNGTYNGKVIVDKIFGLLTALENTGKKNKDNRLIWKFSCKCGKVIEKPARYVVSGNTKSCGCLRRIIAKQNAQKLGRKYGQINGRKNGGSNKLPFGVSGFNRLYAKYKHEAKKRNRAFNIEKEQFKKLTSGICFYCGSVPAAESICPRGHGLYIYNGIDRVDSKQGYLFENSVSCCRICNIMKHNLSQKEFYKHISKILKHVGEDK